MAASASGPQIFDDANRSPGKTSMFRAIMSPKTHKRNQSADDAVAPRPLQRSKPSENTYPFGDEPTLHGGCHPLSEIIPNRDAGDNGVPVPKVDKMPKGPMHKKTKSAVSLKSLRSYMERKDGKPEEPTGEGEGLSPKKAKSSTSLSAILKRSQRGRKGDGSKQSRDKENRSPTDLIDNMPSPMWGGDGPQDSASVHREPGRLRPTSTTDTQRTVAEEVSLYTPKGYGPSQQRNFYDYHQPSIAKGSDAKPRPKSDILTGNRKVKDLFGLQRATSRENEPAAQYDNVSTKSRGPPSPRKAASPTKEEPKRLSRVQAAISAFNAKERDADVHQHLNSKDLESEFEKLLDARNIPHNMRDKMRSLDTNIKADFIQKDRTENTPLSAGTGDSRRGRGKESQDGPTQDRKGSRSRSRSRGFTLTKGPSSPGKKLRRDSEASNRRPKSVDLSQPVGVYTTLSAAASTASLSEAAAVDTAADPSDFVHYLREIQKPEMVEVGKVHKLRLLLRNETVNWVNGFIIEGGMDEIVQLLYRIMNMTWREDHEDTLLHEALLCLKALCTTSVALAHLSSIEDELFPALLKMVFDEEKKGPSEFTTRGIIANLLFTQLSTAPAGEMAVKRTRQILGYLQDPAPPEDNQPLSFIANIYQSRPYRVWCKEVTNVTKEVFWIFLHHLNVVQLPKTEDVFGEKSPEDTRPYVERHFPPPRPPVPAAPYVGGVEWDATNYLAAHLDLVNGLIASLPTPDERNQLRAELRSSGFEKVMGGSLRTCKEKFYSSVHDCLRTWVAAAADDGWPYTFVREGPPRAGEPGSPTKSPKKSAPGSPRKGLVDERPPKLELALDFSDNRPAPGPSTPSSDLRSWL
ncbi:hypothetical protein PENANT_c005G09477 [Penicillium antarcticum]|uniref:Formin GTPase-binding domain-containing protein n=1 Tax=Penicillium antarcticum TaxID=416450 RepID=A0A1V6QF07_9EURO|nr:uncharacterized protein N7508_007734 [Penicillium antarcticum]KAJ5297485.1 hypothetical protein N7508_007734 [Penicillium antarcticum]OQD87789.1 hypothetical protein PENANT_c005G09477 [Penicillium antarcticum]